MFTTDKPSILAMPRGVLGLWLLAFVVGATVITWKTAPLDWGVAHRIFVS